MKYIFIIISLFLGVTSLAHEQTEECHSHSIDYTEGDDEIITVDLGCHEHDQTHPDDTSIEANCYYYDEESGVWHRHKWGSDCDCETKDEGEGYAYQACLLEEFEIEHEHEPDYVEPEPVQEEEVERAYRLPLRAQFDWTQLEIVPYEASESVVIELEVAIDDFDMCVWKDTDKIELDDLRDCNIDHCDFVGCSMDIGSDELELEEGDYWIVIYPFLDARGDWSLFEEKLENN